MNKLFKAMFIAAMILLGVTGAFFFCLTIVYLLVEHSHVPSWAIAFFALFAIITTVIHGVILDE